jgi:protein-L-isoaspartate(D-aspartate) O-methyltransferase
MMPQADVESARFNMVEQQIRPWDVLDPQVIDLLFRVHREDYVPHECRSLAFADLEIPLGHGEKMMPPKLEAKILQALELKSTDRVLEVGTGSGYMTALLASLAAHVYTVDIVPEFTESARAKLRAHGCSNVTLDTGDAARGWSKHAPYDVIVLTGSTPVLPDAFRTDLQPGGRLLAIVGESPIMEARLVTCISRGVYNTTDLFETCIAPLRNALQPERFVF